jgi:hypothetical protein
VRSFLVVQPVVVGGIDCIDTTMHGDPLQFSNPNLPHPFDHPLITRRQSLPLVLFPLAWFFLDEVGRHLFFFDFQNYVTRRV